MKNENLISDYEFEILIDDMESVESYLDDFCRNLSQPRGQFYNYDTDILPEGFKFN